MSNVGYVDFVEEGNRLAKKLRDEGAEVEKMEMCACCVCD